MLLVICLQLLVAVMYMEQVSHDLCMGIESAHVLLVCTSLVGDLVETYSNHVCQQF